MSRARRFADKGNLHSLVLNATDGSASDAGEKVLLDGTDTSASNAGFTILLEAYKIKLQKSLSLLMVKQSSMKIYGKDPKVEVVGVE